jgi:LacI family transcriptional regulator
MPNTPTRKRSGSAKKALPSGRKMIRRHVLLLLGFYNVSLHSGIIRYAKEAGWALDDTYQRSGETPAWWSGDGILSLITSPKDVRAWEQFPSRLPIVDLSKGWISESMPEEDRIDGRKRHRVYYDNTKIGAMAADHFLQRGFRHIAYLNVGNYWHETERIEVIRQDVESAGASFHEIDFYHHFLRNAPNALVARQRAQEWLTDVIEHLPKPLGIILSSDDWANCVLQACEAADAAVPEQVSVLGCDNDPTVCHCTPVPLSSIDVNWDAIGYEAAAMLDRLMEGEKIPFDPVLIPPAGVMTRMSTNILAITDARIARALSYIWDHYTLPIGSEEVAREAGLNRRTLERGFRKHLNRSVWQEITRVRIEKAKSMLWESTAKAHEIAEQCGFSGIVAFSKVFLRITGIRPSEYRKSKKR